MYALKEAKEDDIDTRRHHRPKSAAAVPGVPVVLSRTAGRALSTWGHGLDQRPNRPVHKADIRPLDFPFFWSSTHYRTSRLIYSLLLSRWTDAVIVVQHSLAFEAEKDPFHAVWLFRKRRY